MRKVLFISILSLFVLAFAFYGGKARAQMGHGMMGGGGYGGWHCPYCGQHMGPGGGYGMGPGMMGPGYGMGPGMMGPGYGGQYGPQYGPQYQQPRKPLEERDAKAMLENYIQSTRNPNLKLGKIKDVGPAFEGEILTKENSLVDKILVDKGTGWMGSIY
ncbi:MAG: hypothetical protein ACETWT_03650 [Thermodesulfobacteriota bacterium]|jgi:hypothetical protein